MSTRCVFLLALLILGSTDAQLTKTDEKRILKYHNEARSRVRPTAANMIPLMWDDDLAQKAQKWADQCIDGHNPNKFTDDGDWVGENLAVNTGGTLMEMLEEWEEEKYFYDFGTNACRSLLIPEQKYCGNYKQMVWAETKKVGCGFKSGCPGACSNILVCNYWNAGNLEDQQPFESGDECSRCPVGYKGCVDNLCIGGYRQC